MRRRVRVWQVKRGGFPLWRALAALTHVGTGTVIGLAVACDEVVFALALAPLLVATLLVVAERSLGAFLVLTAAVPPIALVAAALLPPTEPVPAWEVCLAFSLTAVIVFALLAPRLMRFDAPVALIATALALVVGVGITTAAAGPVGELQESIWRHQGEREAAADWSRGRLSLKAFGMGGGPYVGREDELWQHGIGVQHVADCVIPRKYGSQWIGYNEAAERIIRARHGDVLMRNLCRCRFGLPEAAPSDSP